MSDSSMPAFDEAFGALRQFTRARRASSRAVEFCELCGTGLAHEHPHLVNVAQRQIVCACDACALLFDGREKARYKRVSRRVLQLASFTISDGQWEGLLIPISMAFFFHSSVEGRVIALYPSPAGAVESLLPLEAWNEIAESNPALLHLQPDIEALLVNRVGHAQGLGHAEYYIAPIDACYKLTGLMRASWKGLSGGSEVWTEIARFFADLRSQADVVSGDAHA
ncbi:MAG: DUF5947 family protein [Acidobacteriaceae bacterium]